MKPQVCDKIWVDDGYGGKVWADNELYEPDLASLYEDLDNREDKLTRGSTNVEFMDRAAGLLACQQGKCESAPLIGVCQFLFTGCIKDGEIMCFHHVCIKKVRRQFLTSY